MSVNAWLLLALAALVGVAIGGMTGGGVVMCQVYYYPWLWFFLYLGLSRAL
jgi:hypothetical protein